MTIDYFEGEDQKAEAPPMTLERLTSLAADAKVLESEILTDSAALGEKQDRLDKILRQHIPEIFKALEIEEYKLKDGSKIVVKPDVKCSISEERKPAAFLWLRENEYDGIIKTNVSAAFGKGEAAEAEKARLTLVEAGFDANMAETVHPSTLKSFVKERLEAGDNLPLDVFGVFEFSIAKITAPKARK